MPRGKGTYGSKVGRPSKKKKLDKYQKAGEMKLGESKRDMLKRLGYQDESINYLAEQDDWDTSGGPITDQDAIDKAKFYGNLVDPTKKMLGGSVTDAKRLRNNSRGGARKNR
jgi:hypothetical protein